MIRHLFKLIWNRKQGNFLMIAEIFFSFLVLFGVSSLVIQFYQNYQKPIGFSYENVWMLTVTPQDVPNAEQIQRLEQMVNELEAFTEVEHLALGSANGPYTNNVSTTIISKNDLQTESNYVEVKTLDFDKVMNLQLDEGRWFNKQDITSNRKPAVITKDLKHKLFGDEPALNQVISLGKKKDGSEDEQLVIGVVEAYKPTGEFENEAASFFTYSSYADTSVAHTRGRSQSFFYIKVKPGTAPAFEEQLIEKATDIAPGWTYNIRPLEDMRTGYMKESIIPFAALFIVCLFLILNVALGLYGVLWQSINKRYAEIGLRRAIGASSGSIYRQFLGEIVVLATFGLLLGCFFAVQFPLLGVFNLAPEIYITAIIVSVITIYLLVIVCALYPSRQAASIHPAMALHEE